MSDLFYIQNSGHVGNCLIWWRIDGHGYTTNLDEAWKVDATKAASICSSRPKQDIPWPVAAIDAAAIRHLDSECAFWRDEIRKKGHQ